MTEIFTAFKDKVFEKAGFYVLKWQAEHGVIGNREEMVWADKPRDEPQSRCCSFWCTVHNPHPDAYHDCGICRWPGHYSISYQPQFWRPMTTQEESEFRQKLFKFDRPSRFNWSKTVDENMKLKTKS